MRFLVLKALQDSVPIVPKHLRPFRASLEVPLTFAIRGYIQI